MSADSFFFGVGACVGGISAINLTSGWNIIATLFFVVGVAILGGFAWLWVPEGYRIFREWLKTVKSKHIHHY